MTLKSSAFFLKVVTNSLSWKKGEMRHIFFVTHVFLTRANNLSRF